MVWGLAPLEASAGILSKTHIQDFDGTSCQEPTVSGFGIMEQALGFRGSSI